MTKILVVAEHFDGEIISSTSKTVNCASQISESIDVLVLGNDNSIASKASTIEAVTNVLTISNEAFEYPVSSILSPVVAEISKEYDCILLPSSTFGRDLAPRISAILDVNQVTDIMSVEGERVFKRPIYAGNAIQTIKIADGQKILGTVRTASFKELGNSNSANVAWSMDRVAPYARKNRACDVCLGVLCNPLPLRHAPPLPWFTGTLMLTVMGYGA